MKKKVGIIRKAYRKILFRNIDKIYVQHFSQRQRPRNNKKVLDVGTGFGFDLINKCRQGYNVYGIDNDKFRIKKTKIMFEKNGIDATIKVADATKIPFKNNFFDEVMCSHVIEHVRDDRKCIREIYRVLKKNGKLYLRVPNIHNLHTRFHMKIGSRKPFTDSTHFREYDKKELVKLLKKEKFKIKSVKQSGFFLPFGLKFFMVAAHYLPWGQLMEYFGEKYPNRAAEIKIAAVK